MPPKKILAIALLLILLANLPGLKQVFAPFSLRSDSDTAAMLDAIHKAGGLAGAGRWFTGDWLLENGFYRPTTSLSLALDYALYGETAWGYRLTNWLLALFTAIGVYFCLGWFFALSPRYAPFSSWLAMAVALSLSLQQVATMDIPGRLSAWWLVAIALIIWWLGTRKGGGREVGKYGSMEEANVQSPTPNTQHLIPNTFFLLWCGIGAILWGWERLTGFEYSRMISWVPSRTALLMTCFGIWSLYGFICWGEGDKETRRQGDKETTPPLTPDHSPLTTPQIIFLLATLAFAAALGAYEQPLMLAPLITVLALAFRARWRRRSWGIIAVVWGLCLLYLVLRLSLLPLEPTRYQQQQMRSSLSVWGVQYVSELLPVANDYTYWGNGEWSIYMFLLKDPWDHLIMDLAFLGVLYACWRERRWFGWWLLWQAITYLPMSFLHPFEHYYYLPQIGKDAIDIGLLRIGFRLLTEANK